MKTYRIGRDQTNDIVIDDESVSRAHAELREAVGENFRIVDLKSTFGTGVMRDGRWVQVQDTLVARTDPIRFGNYVTTVADIMKGIGVKAASARPRRKRTETRLHDALPRRLALYGVAAASVIAIVGIAIMWILSAEDSEKRFVKICVERSMPLEACKCAGAALKKTLTAREFTELTDHFGDLTSPSLDLLPKLPAIMSNMSNCGLKQL
ncbi:MAG: FHA domain-containing protein [Alphaproteobacteria bacterium]